MMEAGLAIVAILTAWSLGVMKTVDLIRRVLDPNRRWNNLLTDIVALAVAVGTCVAFEYDATAQALALIPRFAEDSTRLAGLAGQIITGFGVWAIATFGHEIRDGIRAKAGKQLTNTPTPRA